ncbi:MAG: Crp/Fnr family transcriptional regulator [Cyclobacteriaceae bacterium]|jgi:CRP-like cAMP-binding protein|nr:Crp/Fnr family transcriptional regulator [Cyclobacteriaceae bacterium]
MTDNHFLKKIFEPQNFKKDDLEKVLNQYEKITFSKNEFLIEEGSTANFYYFLESGFARSYVIDLEGNDISTNFYSTTDIVIDWHSYFLKAACRENIQAITPCIAWKITFEKFMKLFSIEAFREVGRTRLINNYFELKKHSISIIADPAKDRYLNLLKSKPDIMQNVPLKQIATYLGITDTSLSRIRKEVTDTK